MRSLFFYSLNVGFFSNGLWSSKNLRVRGESAAKLTARMQDLEQPIVYRYETSEDPSIEALKARLREDGADSSANILGILVKVPPDTLYGVERHDVEVFYGEAYSHLTSQSYRNRDALDWLTRGAADNPELVVTNLQTTLAEVQAGREPFAWQLEQLNQTGNHTTAFFGVGLVIIVLSLLLVYFLKKRRTAATPYETPAHSINQLAKKQLESRYLELRYGEALSGYLKPHSQEAKRVRDLLFGDAKDLQIYNMVKAALDEDYPPAKLFEETLPSRHLTPFDKKIETAFHKISKLLRAKQLELESCFYQIDTLEDVQEQIEALLSALAETKRDAETETAHSLLETQLERLSTLDAEQAEQKVQYEEIARQLRRDMKEALAYKDQLLKKRELYALVESSVALQKDVSTRVHKVDSSNDLQTTLQEVDDFIEAYMELPVPSYSAPSLVDLETVLDK